MACDMLRYFKIHCFIHAIFFGVRCLHPHCLIPYIHQSVWSWTKLKCKQQQQTTFTWSNEHELISTWTLAWSIVYTTIACIFMETFDYLQAFDEETTATEGLELDIVDQMKDLMLGEGGSTEEKEKLTRDSPIFHTQVMSTKVLIISLTNFHFIMPTFHWCFIFIFFNKSVFLLQLKAVMDKLYEIRELPQKQKRYWPMLGNLWMNNISKPKFCEQNHSLNKLFTNIYLKFWKMYANYFLHICFKHQWVSFNVNFSLAVLWFPSGPRCWIS